MVQVRTGGRARGVEAGPACGDDGFFETLREREFSRLDAGGHAYLDYTGSALPGERQLQRAWEGLRTGVFGNPHSENPASLRSTEVVEAARRRILGLLGADPAAYRVCFTGNATGALRLVGEAFPFRTGSRLVLSADNHNSVNGIRELAQARGARVTYLPLDGDLRLADPLGRLGDPGPAPSLLAYPAQSNFSGVRHPTGLAATARSRGFRTLVDAAAFAPTARLELGTDGPDFVCLSFYKVFGYPTGVGALVARRDALSELARPWFAGGTVRWVSTQHDLHALEDGPARFEDGTLPFLAIAALAPGLDLLDEVGLDRIGRRVQGLTAHLLDGLDGLRHPGGEPLVRVYGPPGGGGRGGTVAFNVLDPAGRAVPYDDVVAACGRAAVSVRGGCFCNPGASEAAFGFPSDAALRCLRQLGADFTPRRLSACMGGVPAGAVRASPGIATRPADLDRLLEVLDGFARPRRADALTTTSGEGGAR